MPARARRQRLPTRDRDAIVTLEFALIAPLMTTCLVGTIELTNAIRVQAKVNVAAGQLAELVAGQPAVMIGTVSNAAYLSQSLTDMCNGASLNILPYVQGNMQASIVSTTVGTNAGGAYLHPITDWTTDTSCGATSYHWGGSAGYNAANAPRSLFTADGTSYVFPSQNGGGGAAVAGYSAISVQVRYQYANILPRFLGSTITLVGVAVARPRSNATIPCTTSVGGTPAACPTNS
jgi:Flp pilus assembly protein TadG